MEEEDERPSSLQVTILGQQSRTRLPFHDSFAHSRSNLTALSQTRNLFFVAIREAVCVYKPNYPEQAVNFEIPIVTLRPKSIKNLGGFMDNLRPHCINHIITEFIGSQEVLLMTHDDGDLFAYWIDQIDHVAKTNLQSGRDHDDHDTVPWLSYNVEKSAWGIAVHRRTRAIAVSANTTRVTVLKPALANPHIESDSDPLSEEHDSELDAGERTLHYVQYIMETRHNIPCVSFCNFRSQKTDIASSSSRYDTQNSQKQLSDTTWASIQDDENSNSLLVGNIIGQTFVWGINGTKTDINDDEQPTEEGPVLREMFTAHRCPTAPLACQCFIDRLSFPHAVWGLHWVDPKWFRDEGRSVKGKVEPSGHWELDPEVESLDMRVLDLMHRLWDDFSDDEDDEDDEYEEEEENDEGNESETQGDIDDLLTEITGTLAAGQNGERASGRRLSQISLPNFLYFPQSGRRNPFLGVIDRLNPVFRTKYFSANEHKMSIPTYPILQMSSNQIALYTRVPAQGGWSLEEGFEKEFTTVAMQFPLAQESSPWNGHMSVYDRFIYHAVIPELGVFIAAALNGRVAIYSLEKVTIRPRRDLGRNASQSNGRAARNAQNAEGYGSEKRLAFSLIKVLPTKEQEDNGQRPQVPMMGIAVSPIQGEQVTVDANGQVLHDSGGSAKRRGGSRRYRLLMTYADGSLLSYELSRLGTGLGVLQFV